MSGSALTPWFFHSTQESKRLLNVLLKIASWKIHRYLRTKTCRKMAISLHPPCMTLGKNTTSCLSLHKVKRDLTRVNMQQPLHCCYPKSKYKNIKQLLLHELRYFVVQDVKLCQAIVSNGLENYYSFRSEMAEKVADHSSEILQISTTSMRNIHRRICSSQWRK